MPFERGTDFRFIDRFPDVFTVHVRSAANAGRDAVRATRRRAFETRAAR